MKGTEDNCMFFIFKFTCVLNTGYGLSSCTLCLDDPGKLAPCLAHSKMKLPRCLAVQRQLGCLYMDFSVCAFS